MSVYRHKAAANVHFLSKSYKSLALVRIWDSFDTLNLKPSLQTAAENATRNWTGINTIEVGHSVWSECNS